MLGSYLLSFASILVSAAAQWPDPIPLTGNNSFIHDPSVIQKDGTYYRFSTFGRIYIASAPNMTGPWTVLGRAINDGGSIINLAGNDVLWAPDVSELNGTYYLYYAVSVSGSQNSEIGVATSTQLTPGSWTDHGSIGIPKSSAYNKIDPNLLITDSGTPLMTFGSYWHDIYQIELASPPLKIADGAVAKNIEYNSTARAGSGQQEPEVMEGAYQFKYTVNGTTWYYLFWSSGDCCSVPPKLPAAGDEYKVMVGRSSSPTGPWVDESGNDILKNGGKLVLGSHGDHVYAPGGQGVMYDQAAEAPLMYYHYVDPTVGYGIYDFMFGWNWLDFSTGWPVVVENAVTNATGGPSASGNSKEALKSSADRAGGPRSQWILLLVSALLLTVSAG